jgi:hypothetical protein
MEKESNFPIYPKSSSIATGQDNLKDQPKRKPDAESTIFAGNFTIPIQGQAMRLFFTLFGCLLIPGLAVSQTNLLQKAPREANLLIMIEKPSELVVTVTQHDIARKAQQLPQLQQLLTSTNAKRFFQLLNYAERESGMSWQRLIEAIAGDGMLIASTIPDPAPTLLILEGRNPEDSARVFQLMRSILEQELARNFVDGQNTPKLLEEKLFGFDTLRLGDDFHVCHSGKTTYIANQKPALQAGLKLLQSKNRDASLAGRAEPLVARKLLGGDPAAWLWLDFAGIHEQQSTKDFFAATRKDFLQTIVLGSSIDAFRRTNMISAGLYINGRNLEAKLRLPVKRADLPKEFSVHAPNIQTAGSLPFLEPKNVLYSQSFYLDLASLWTNRKSLYNPEILKDLEKGIADISRVLPGVNIGKVLEMSGSYQRIVAVSTDYGSYQVKPDQPLPALAFVTNFRDPAFAKSATAMLRAGGLVGSIQTGLKMTETQVNGTTIVSYKFPENRTMESDSENLRFNFVPSFAIVDDNLIVSSQPKLVEELISEVRRKRNPEESSRAVWRGKIYGSGAAGFQKLVPESSLSQLVLSEGITLPEAKKQLAVLGEFFEQLGTATLELDHAENWFEIAAKWQPK